MQFLRWISNLIIFYLDYLKFQICNIDNYKQKKFLKFLKKDRMFQEKKELST